MAGTRDINMCSPESLEPGKTISGTVTKLSDKPVHIAIVKLVHPIDGTQASQRVRRHYMEHTSRLSKHKAHAIKIHNNGKHLIYLTELLGTKTFG